MPELTYQQKEILNVVNDFSEEDTSSGFKPSIKVFGMQRNSKAFAVTMGQLKQIHDVLAAPYNYPLKFPANTEISKASHRIQDIVVACTTALRILDSEAYDDFLSDMSDVSRITVAGIREMLDDDDSVFWSLEPLQYYVDEHMYEYMERYAPDGCIFGMHEGDGSLLGYWEITEELEG